MKNVHKSIQIENTTSGSQRSILQDCMSRSNSFPELFNLDINAGQYLYICLCEDISLREAEIQK